MGAMYKIVSYTPLTVSFRGMPCTAKKFKGFEQAKQAMFDLIKVKFEGIEKMCATLIDAYCKEYYQNCAPHNFELLKQLINEYITDPATFEKIFEEKYADIDFKDERVHFSFEYEFTPEGVNRGFYIQATQEVEQKFPQGIINFINLKELVNAESERVVSLIAGEDRGTQLAFSLMTDDDEDNFPWED